MREVLIEKLRPDRFTAMSGRMAAIAGYILDERFSDPAISELLSLIEAAGLSDEEIREFGRLQRERIRRY